MSRFVFVLGAGASAAAKAPLAANFMDKARLLLRSGGLPGIDEDAFNLVFKARDALKAVHSKADLNLGDLEVLFGAFEMAALFGRLGSLSETEVGNLPQAMRRVISRTVERTMEFPILSSPATGNRSKGWTVGPFPKLMPPPPYEPFANLLAKMGQWNGNNSAVITFNYDLGMDHALHFSQMPYSYGLSESSDGTIDLLKLHGSLNWGRCSMCKEVLPLDIGSCLQRLSVPAAGSTKFEVSGDLPLLKHCGFPLKAEPLIVPPTWNKGIYHSQLDRVWKKAARHLSEAEYIFVIGYSYPQTDEFFRYLYALGSIGDGWLEKIIVFNPDAAVGERIKGLLGPLARGKFGAFEYNFEQAVSYLTTLNLS